MSSAGMWRRILVGSLSNKWQCQQKMLISSSVIEKDKVYEFRTYGVWPQHLKAFLTLTTEELHLRTRESKLIGYWTSELGGLNEVVHIWEYDSLEHRAKVRQSLANNSEWIQKYFSKILPMLSGQQNAILKAVSIPQFTSDLMEAKGVYQVQNLHLQNLGIDVEKLIQSLVDIKQPGGLLVGAFQTLQGSMNDAVLLWKHPTLSAANNFVSSQLKGGEPWTSVASGHCKILVPHLVSPLQ